jgi:hypothetical protein
MNLASIIALFISAFGPLGVGFEIEMTHPFWALVCKMIGFAFLTSAVTMAFFQEQIVRYVATMVAAPRHTEPSNNSTSSISIAPTVLTILIWVLVLGFCFLTATMAGAIWHNHIVGIGKWNNLEASDLLAFMNAVKAPKDCQIRIAAAENSTDLANLYIETFKVVGCTIVENQADGTYVFPLPSNLPQDGITLRYKPDNLLGSEIGLGLAEMRVNATTLQYPDSDPRAFIEFDIGRGPKSID